MISAQQYYLYILTNKTKTTLFIGSKKDLTNRILQLKQGFGSEFTAKYNLCQLVYFESFGSYDEAFKRERQLKKWNREWKEELINSENPEWNELASGW